MIFIIILVLFSTFILTLLIDKWLIEYLLVKTSSKNHPFIPNKFIVPPNLKNSIKESLKNVKCLDWFNVILARYWLEISRSYGYKERIKKQICRKLGPLRKYVNDIVVEDVDIPQESPILKEIRIITRDQVDRLEDHLKENGLFKSKNTTGDNQNSSDFNQELDQILDHPHLQDDLSQIFCVAKINHSARFSFNIRAHICTFHENSLFPFKFSSTGIDKRSDLVFKSKISFGNYSGRVLVRLPGNNTKYKWEASFIENPNFEVQAEAYLLKNSDQEDILEELNIISTNDLLTADFDSKNDCINVLGDIESSNAHLDLSLEDKKIGKSFFSGFMRKLVEKAINKRIVYPHFHKLPLPGITSSLKVINHQITRFDIANYKEWANTVENNLMIYTSMNYRIKESNEHVLMRKNAYFINGNQDRIGCVEIDFRRPDQKEMRNKIIEKEKETITYEKNQRPDISTMKSEFKNTSESKFELDDQNTESKEDQKFIRDEELRILLNNNTADYSCNREGFQSDGSSLESRYQSFAELSDSICLDDSKEGSILGKEIFLNGAHLTENGSKSPTCANEFGVCHETELKCPIQREPIPHSISRDGIHLSSQIQNVFEKVLSQKLNENVYTSTESTSSGTEMAKNGPLAEGIRQVLGNCEEGSTSSDQDFINGIPKFMKEIPSDDHNTRAVLSYFYNLSIFNSIFPDFSHLMEIKNLDRRVSLIKMYLHGKNNQTETVQDYIRIISENSIIFQRNCIKEPEFLIFKFIDGKLEIYHYFLRLQFNIGNANRLRKRILRGNFEDRSGKELFCTSVKKFLNVLKSAQSQITPSKLNTSNHKTFVERKKQYEKEGLLLKYKRIISLTLTQKNLKDLLNDPYMRLRLLRENIKIVDTQRVTEKITSYKIKDIETNQNDAAEEISNRFGKSALEILSYSDKNQFIDFDVSSGRVCVFSIRLRKSETQTDNLNTDAATKQGNNNPSLEKSHTSTLDPYYDEKVRNHLTILSNFQSCFTIRRCFLTPLMILKQFVPIGEKTEPTFVYNKSIKYIIKKPAGLLHLKLESEISDQFYVSIKINNKIILREVKVVLGHVKMSISLRKPDNTISILIQPKTPRDKKIFLQIQFHDQNVQPIYLKDNLDEEKMMFVSKNVLESHRNDEYLRSEQERAERQPSCAIFQRDISEKEDYNENMKDRLSLSDREYLNLPNEIENDFKFLFECTTLLANQKSFEVKLVSQDRSDNIFWDISPDNNIMVILKEGRTKNIVSFHGNRKRDPDDQIKINVKNISVKRLLRYRVGIISSIIN